MSVTDNWLNLVAYQNSSSKGTEYMYKWQFNKFLDFIHSTAEHILADYEKLQDQAFKRKYSSLLKSWIGVLAKNGLTKGSIRTMVASVQSFFKYNDLPLGFIPQGKEEIVYHNRDITKEEIAKILSVANPRERAFFTMMAQSGLRPSTLCHLRVKHLQPDLDNGVVPCAINVPKGLTKGKFGAYSTFIGDESVKYLKDYLASRPQVTGSSYVFTLLDFEADPRGKTDSVGIDSEQQATNPKSFSNTFRRIVRDLNKQGQIEFEVRRSKKKVRVERFGQTFDVKIVPPAELRLYSLRKFFKKHAGQMGAEVVEYVMGHRVGVADHYLPKDVEYYRKLYAEKAMPFLRIEERTPTEMEKIVEELRQRLEKRDRDFEELSKRMARYEEHVKSMIEIGGTPIEELEEFARAFRQWKEAKILREHEEAHREEE